MRKSVLTVVTWTNTYLNRGLKDPEGARRRMESKAAAAAAVEGKPVEGNMKWQVG